MKRDLAKAFKPELDKLRKAFKVLRQKNIYAQARAMGTESHNCQHTIQHFLDDDDDLQGGVYWTGANELHLEEMPILHLGYLPRHFETRDEMLTKALQIAEEIHQALESNELRVIWNHCVCNTISVVIASPDEISKGLEEELTKISGRPCRCEEIWEMQFKDYAEQRLSNLKGKDHTESEDPEWLN